MAYLYTCKFAHSLAAMRERHPNASFSATAVNCFTIHYMSRCSYARDRDKDPMRASTGSQIQHGCLDSGPGCYSRAGIYNTYTHLRLPVPA